MRLLLVLQSAGTLAPDPLFRLFSLCFPQLPPTIQLRMGFVGPRAPPASAHILIDATSTSRMLWPSHRPWAQPAVLPSPVSTAAPLWDTGCLNLGPCKSLQVNLMYVLWQNAHHHVAESTSGDSLGSSELKISPKGLPNVEFLPQNVALYSSAVPRTIHPEKATEFKNLYLHHTQGIPGILQAGDARV